MPFDFPNSPTNGTTITGPGGVRYTWDGTKWANSVNASAYAPINSPSFSGSPTAPNPATTDQSNAVATTSYVRAAVGQPAADNAGRNLCHNGMFRTYQRGTGNFTTSQAFTADRWRMVFANDTSTVSLVGLTDADRAAIGDESAYSALRNVFTGSATAGSNNAVSQKVEGVRRLSGKTIAISFWARAQTAGLNLWCSISQDFGTGGSPSGAVWTGAGPTPVISTVWTRYTMTASLPSMSGKVLGTNNDDGTTFWFYYSQTGVVQQSGTIDIWGVQIEIGTQASPLERTSFETEWLQTHRFYQSGQMYFGLYGVAGNPMTFSQPLVPQMRGNPTCTSNVYSQSGVALQSMTANLNIVTGQFNITATAMVTGNYGYTASAEL